jgi:formamidopyrimidine-DNA glycosylase
MGRKPPRKRLRDLVGKQLVALRRHGKYLLVDTDGPDTLLVHLGMTGRFCIHDVNEPRREHVHMVLGLAGETRELRFTDARRFGQLDVVVREHEREHPALAVLGPDALTQAIDPATLLAQAKARRTTLKSFVLDQSVVAGVGNIYASEALWRAGLRPSKRSHKLTAVGAEKLALAIREVIDNALVNGGTTLSDFVKADGTKGENADYLWVYDREGKPCPRCRKKAVIKRAVHQGRATYYCPTCQTA